MGNPGTFWPPAGKPPGRQFVAGTGGCTGLPCWERMLCASPLHIHSICCMSMRYILFGYCLVGRKEFSTRWSKNFRSVCVQGKFGARVFQRHHVTCREPTSSPSAGGGAWRHQVRTAKDARVCGRLHVTVEGNSPNTFSALPGSVSARARALAPVHLISRSFFRCAVCRRAASQFRHAWLQCSTAESPL